jgi:hypothetical protein
VRIGKAIMLMVVFVVVPLAVGYAVDGMRAGAAACLGAILVLSSSFTNGRRATRYAVPFAALALVLGAWTKPMPGKLSEAPLDGWLWLLVVAAFAVLSGLATQRGAGVAMSMATLYAVVAPPFRSFSHLLLAMAWLAAGSLYGWFVARYIGAPESSPALRTTPHRARLIALFLGLAAALACLVALLGNLPYSTWIVTAVVVLGIPTPGLTERAMLQRMLGQLGACFIISMVALAINATDTAYHQVLFLIAMVVTALAYLVSLGEPLPLQIALLSAAIMMPTAAREADNVANVVTYRLFENLIGLGILAISLLAIRLWAREAPVLE